jgi:hypothetical protein
VAGLNYSNISFGDAESTVAVKRHAGPREEVDQGAA